MGTFLQVPDNIWENDSFQKAVKIMAYIAFIIYFTMMLSIVATDKNALDEKTNAVYLTLLICPMLLFAYMIFSNLRDKRYLMIVIIMTFAIVITLLWNLLPSFEKVLSDFAKYLTEVVETPPLSKEMSYLVKIILNMLLFAMIIVTMSIGINTFVSGTYRQRGVVGFLVYLLFYIPCALSDYIRYLFNELKMTPKVVYALIILEIVLILLYIFIPKMFGMFIFKHHNKIQTNPIFLWKQTQISDVSPFYNTSDEYKELEKQFNIKNNTDGVDDDNLQINKSLMRNYCISLWATVNPPSLGENEECVIFRISKNYTSAIDPDNPLYGTPYIGCKGAKWKVVYSNNVTDISGNIDENAREEVSTELDIPFQRWNQFVINYHDNQADLFVNGVLRDTKSLGRHIPILTYDQVVIVGSDTRRIHGAVCEVRVHKENLGQNEISQSYNLLKLKNPPVNNLY
jgi:hypothetical protein